VLPSWATDGDRRVCEGQIIDGTITRMFGIVITCASKSLR
jgi:hypothetical protein